MAVTKRRARTHRMTGDFVPGTAIQKASCQGLEALHVLALELQMWEVTDGVALCN